MTGIHWGSIISHSKGTCSFSLPLFIVLFYISCPFLFPGPISSSLFLIATFSYRGVLLVAVGATTTTFFGFSLTSSSHISHILFRSSPSLSQKKRGGGKITVPKTVTQQSSHSRSLLRDPETVTKWCFLLHVTRWPSWYTWISLGDLGNHRRRCDLGWRLFIDRLFSDPPRSCGLICFSEANLCFCAHREARFACLLRRLSRCRLSASLLFVCGNRPRITWRDIARNERLQMHLHVDTRI